MSGQAPFAAPKQGIFTVADVQAEGVLAGALWLLTAAPAIPQAETAWRDGRPTWLVPGVLFSAVLVPADIVHAALGVPDPQDASEPPLSDLLDGPVFFQPHVFKQEGSYVVLLPASVSRIWRVPGTVDHAPRAQLLVPAVDRTSPQARDPWWVVLPIGPGMLGSTALLASLVARGCRRLAELGSGRDE
jgi:hypothetical protein